MAKPKQKARELASLRLEMKKILVAHDVPKFREFIDKNRKFAGKNGVMGSTQEIDRLLTYDLNKLSDFMHYKKTTEPYLNEHFQNSRNHFRLRQLEADRIFYAKANKELESYFDESKEFPQCYECKWFRTAPEGEETSCMGMVPTEERPHQRPALPLDIACIGWTPLDEIVTPVAEVKD